MKQFKLPLGTSCISFETEIDRKARAHYETIELVLKMLQDETVDAEYCSPNFVADFASNRGITLTSNQVVEISNTYETVSE